MDLTIVLLAFLGVGVVAGLLQGLIGVGMALVSVPILAISLPALGIAPAMAPSMALATSMASVTLTGTASVFAHMRRGNVDWTLVRMIVPFSLVGIALGSLLVPRLPAVTLRWVFAAFLVYTAARMVLAARRVIDRPARATSAHQYRLTGFGIGMAASFIGAGGGVLMIPFLNARGHVMARAVATASTIGLPVSLLATISYLLQAPPEPAPYAMGYIYGPAFAGMVLGGIAAAPLGVLAVSVVPPRLVQQVFAAVLVAVSLRLLLT